ncbi:MAG: hypothetical protein ABIP28_06915 [Mucilaginibacter sp.]
MKKFIKFTAIALVACTYISCKKEAPVQALTGNEAKTQLKEVNACTSPPQFLAIRTVGGPNEDVGFNIVLHPSGIVALVGSFSGTVDFDPGAGIKNLSASNGAYFSQWFDRSAKFVNAAIESPAALAYKDKQGNTYDVVAEDGIVTENSVLNCSVASKNYLLEKKDPSGNLLWKSMLRETDENPCRLSFDYTILEDKNGNIIVNSNQGGWKKLRPSGQTLPFNIPANYAGRFWMDAQDNIYVQYDEKRPPNKSLSKYDSKTGKELWYLDMPFSNLDIDAVGNVFITGTFEGTRDFNPGPGTYNLTAAVAKTMFVQKLDANKSFHWAKKLGTGNPAAVKVDPNGKYIFIAGSFDGTQTYSTIAGNVTAISKGKTDAFLIALQQCN